MSWGIGKGGTTNGAPMSGKAAKVGSNGTKSNALRGPLRPGGSKGKA